MCPSVDLMVSQSSAHAAGNMLDCWILAPGCRLLVCASWWYLFGCVVVSRCCVLDVFGTKAAVGCKQ